MGWYGKIWKTLHKFYHLLPLSFLPHRYEGKETHLQSKVTWSRARFCFLQCW